MAWPPSDTWDDAHNTSINGKADDNGNTWALIGGGTNCQVRNDAGQEQQFCNTGGASQGAYHENSATPPSANYDVGCTLRCYSDNNSSSLGVILRGVDNQNWYMARYLTDDSGGFNLQVRKNVANTQADLTNGTATVAALTAGQTATLVARIVGNVIYVWWNGALVITATDGASTFNDPGNAGWRHFGVASNALGLGMDDWYASSIPISDAIRSPLRRLRHLIVR